MNFKIGQIWQVTWVQGSEVLPSHGRSQRIRTAILTGSEAINGQAANLYFSVPMIEGRRGDSACTVAVDELHALIVGGQAKLLGQLFIDPPDEDFDTPRGDEQEG